MNKQIHLMSISLLVIVLPLHAKEVLKEQDFDRKALNDINYVISKHPNQASGYVRRAQVYSDLKMRRKSIADWTKAIKLEPQTSCSASSYVCRGLELEKLNRQEEAMSDFNSAVKFANGHFYPYQCRASFFLRKRQFARAIDDYNKAIKLAQDKERASKRRLGNIVEYLTGRRNYAQMRLEASKFNL